MVPDVGDVLDEDVEVPDRYPCQVGPEGPSEESHGHRVDPGEVAGFI